LNAALHATDLGVARRSHILVAVAVAVAAVAVAAAVPAAAALAGSAVAKKTKKHAAKQAAWRRT